MSDYYRHDISDFLWELLKPYLPGREGVRGVTAKDNRCLLMLYFGFYEPVRFGVICLLIMEVGKIPIAVFVVGVTEEFRKNFLK